jgi:hypothetical protein
MTSLNDRHLAAIRTQATTNGQLMRRHCLASALIAA